MRLTTLAASCCLLLLAACQRSPSSSSPQQQLPELKLPVFAAPSQSLWLPTLIQALKLDEKQGFRLTVTPKPGPVAYADFASGAEPICYCAAPAAVARFVQQGADITLLWNVFDLDFFIVTDRADIQSLRDIAGKRVGADTSTGSWAVAAWLLQQNGLDVPALHVQSLNSPALVASLGVQRLDAAVLGLIETASLETGAGISGYRIISLNRDAVWQKFSSSKGIPSIAFGVWRPWLEDPVHVDLVRKLYRANKEAADYIRQQPRQAAHLVSEATSMSESALFKLFTENDTMIDIRPMSEYRDAVQLLTQQLLPAAHQLDRPLTDAELSRYVSDFQP